MTKYPTIWYELLCESEYPNTLNIGIIPSKTTGETNMTENKWTEFTEKITQWKRANKGWNDPEHKSYQEDLDSLDRIMKKGRKDEGRRARIMSTVRTLFMDIPTSPFRTGKASSIDAGMLATYNKSRIDARTALITAWNASKFLQMYEVKSKRGGGGVFATAEEYADYQLSSSDSRVHSAMRGTSKDYQFADGKPLINIIPQKED